MSYPCAICQGPHTTGFCIRNQIPADQNITITYTDCAKCKETEIKLEHAQMAAEAESNEVDKLIKENGELLSQLVSARKLIEDNVPVSDRTPVEQAVWEALSDE